MSFGLWCIVIGGVAWLGSYLLKDLFVDASDVENPMRMLTSAVGYIGIAVAVYGIILVIVRAL